MIRGENVPLKGSFRSTTPVVVIHKIQIVMYIARVQNDIIKWEGFWYIHVCVYGYFIIYCTTSMYLFAESSVVYAI